MGGMYEAVVVRITNRMGTHAYINIINVEEVFITCIMRYTVFSTS